MKLILDLKKRSLLSGQTVRFATILKQLISVMAFNTVIEDPNQTALSKDFVAPPPPKKAKHTEPPLLEAKTDEGVSFFIRFIVTADTWLTSL